MMRAFLFPGQGSQKVGMGAELADASEAAREVFGEVDEALKQKLSALMREGPEDQLTLTENAQPAIMANAIATLRVLENDFGVILARHGSCVAGHSLGEYSALCAVGSFSLADTARLLKLRGQAMQSAVPVGEGAMAVLLGADLAQAKALAEVAAQDEVCEVANDNDPTQVVISGHREAIERAIALAKEHGIKRGNAAAGVRPVPLFADAACRRPHGGGAGRNPPPAAFSLPVYANVYPGRAGHRSRCGNARCWSNRSPARVLLARKRACHARRWGGKLRRTGRQGAGTDGGPDRPRCAGCQPRDDGRS